MTTLAVVVASFLGLSALILDAVGAHALSQVVPAWLTAVRTQMSHALFLLALVGLADKLHPLFFQASVGLATLGIILFSGSIYLKTLAQMESATRVAPYGGFMLMLAWLCLAIGFVVRK